MTILIDTHYLVWLATDQDKLTEAERRLMIESRQVFLLSTISIWEVRIKSCAEQRRGLEILTLRPEQAIDFAMQSNLPIVAPAVEDYAARLSHPLDHTDPFDEMLLVHAQQIGGRLLTRDRRLRDHPLTLRA